jgi:chromosome segregation ATPase
VTLVSGQNGSGKSAVIQALQVCLGASARETSRARSFPAFVKEGCSEARVHVTLWNVGEDAFMPDK